MNIKHKVLFRIINLIVILTFLSSNVSFAADLTLSYKLRQTNPGQAQIKEDLQQILGAGDDSSYTMDRTAPDEPAQPQPLFTKTLDWNPFDASDLVDCNICRICDSSDIEKTGISYIVDNVRFEIMRCKKDGFMWVTPGPKEELVKVKIYQNEKYFGKDRKILPIEEIADWRDIVNYGYSMYLDDTSMAKRIKQFKKIISELFSRNYLDTSSRETDKILDIGTGAGYFLLALNSYGYPLENLYGAEISKIMIDAAIRAGLISDNIMHDDIESLGNSRKDKFDIITAFDLLEHLYHPRAFLNNVKLMLKGGGRLIMVVPTCSNEGPSIIRSLEHINYFTPFSMRTLLENNGFEDIQIEIQPHLPDDIVPHPDVMLITATVPASSKPMQGSYGMQMVAPDESSPPQPETSEPAMTPAEQIYLEAVLNKFVHDIGNKITPMGITFHFVDIGSYGEIPPELSNRISSLRESIDSFYSSALIASDEKDPEVKLRLFNQLLLAAPPTANGLEESAQAINHQLLPLTNLKRQSSANGDVTLYADMDMIIKKIQEIKGIFTAQEATETLSFKKLYDFAAAKPTDNQPKVIIAPKELFLDTDSQKIIGLKAALLILSLRKLANGEPEFKVVVPCSNIDECDTIKAMNLPGVSAQDFPDFDLDGVIPPKAVVGILNPTGVKNLHNVIVIARPLGSSYMSANPLHIDPEVNYLTQHGCNVLVPEIPEGKDKLISAFKIFHSAVTHLNKENNGSVIYIQPVKLPSQFYRQVDEYLKGLAEALEKA